MRSRPTCMPMMQRTHHMCAHERPPACTHAHMHARTHANTHAHAHAHAQPTRTGAGHSVRTRLFGLNISRMLGDRFLKDEDLGFIAEPFVSAVQVGAC